MKAAVRFTPSVEGFGLTWTGPRCNSGASAGMGLSTCLCIHAEENALLEAGRDRIREGSILYCDTLVPVHFRDKTPAKRGT